MVIHGTELVQYLGQPQTPLPWELCPDSLDEPKAIVCTARCIPLRVATTDWDRNDILPEGGQSEFLSQAFGI